MIWPCPSVTSSGVGLTSSAFSKRRMHRMFNRCAALVEMQRLADEALSSAHPPLLSSAKPRQRRRRQRQDVSTGAFSLSPSSSSSAEEGSEDRSRDRSGEQGREDGEGEEAASAGEQEQAAGVAKLLAAWRAEILKLLLQRGADAEVAAAESREARRKVAEEKDARGWAETEARVGFVRTGSISFSPFLSFCKPSVLLSQGNSVVFELEASSFVVSSVFCTPR